MVQDAEIGELEWSVVPVEPADIESGNRYHIVTKVGSNMTLVTVNAKGKPYPVTFKDGRKVDYVDVFGYGVSQRIRADRLYKAVRNDE